MSNPQLALSRAILGAAAATIVSLPRPVASQEHVHKDPPKQEVRIPESMRIEHQEIHAELVRATQEPGAVGEAARALAEVLHPHFVREEQIALPPLGLLAPLARGERADWMRSVLPMTDSLRAELPRMLKEHEAIRVATSRLGQVAKESGRDWVVRLTESLKLHAQGEEELFYPAAVLVGELVRMRLMGHDR